MTSALKIRRNRGCIDAYCGTFTKRKRVLLLPIALGDGFVPAFNWSDRRGSSLIVSAR